MTAPAGPGPVVRALERALPDFLPRQRWFGAKGRPLDAVAVEDLIPLAAAAAAGPWLAVARLGYADGGAERYALVVRLDAGDSDLPVIGPAGDRGARLVEAAVEPATALALLAALEPGRAPGPADGTRIAGGDLLPGPRGRFRPSALAPADLRALGAEQSNTSLRLPEHVVKLFRRLEDGENPELEIGRFLTARTAFRAMGAVRGSLTLVRPDGTRSTLAVVQDWIENRGDGWVWALAALAAASRDADAATEAARDIERLGATTADFHLAVASADDDPAFAPEPLAAAVAGAWVGERRERAARATGLLDAALDRLDPADREAAGRVLARAPALAAAGAPAGAGFDRIRVHGDFHLGQTLRGRDGWVLVDFEGEPARTLARRREKHAALKDVAGMLRSFDYAAEAVRRADAAAASRAGTTGDDAGDAPGRVAAAWREAFLAGYLGRARPGEARFLPATPGGLRAWIAFFELDKALYELEYEIHSRPGWVGIPLRGILRAGEATGDDR